MSVVLRLDLTHAATVTGQENNDLPLPNMLLQWIPQQRHGCDYTSIIVVVVVVHYYLDTHE